MASMENLPQIISKVEPESQGEIVNDVEMLRENMASLIADLNTIAKNAKDADIETVQVLDQMVYRMYDEISKVLKVANGDDIGEAVRETTGQRATRPSPTFEAAQYHGRSE